MTNANPPREMTFLLASVERRVLRALAALVPRQLRPNHLTVLGTLGAVGAGVAYALTSRHPGWLWVASAGRAINCLGDSLDGTLARQRSVERPRYGYYLDHLVDAFSTAVIGIGLGLSPYVDFAVAMGLVLVYLVLSINVYLESTVFGVFRLSYGRIGPTEVRLLLMLINTAIALASVNLAVLVNRALILVLLGMVAMLVVRFARNLSHLAKLEPQEFRRRQAERAAQAVKAGA